MTPKSLDFPWKGVYRHKMNKPDESYSSINFGPVGWHPPDFSKKLSDQERRENANRDIDNAEREIALIRQGVGRWPDFTVGERIEGLLSSWGLYLNFDVPKVTSDNRVEQLEYIEQRLKIYREEIDETFRPLAVSSAEAVESELVRVDEQSVFTTRRISAWAAAIGSGGTGWYLSLASAGVVSRMESWFVDYFLLTGAVVAWIFCFTPVQRDMDIVVSKWASRGPYLRCDLLRKREERIARWLMVPFVIWWLPILLAIFGGLVRD